MEGGREGGREEERKRGREGERRRGREGEREYALRTTERGKGEEFS